MGVIIKNCDSDSMGEREDLRRRKKKRSPRGSLCTTFQDQYTLPGEVLGEGNTGKVETCVNVFTGQPFAVKIIKKTPGTFNRPKILREIELYHQCRGVDTIVQLVEFFEETDFFYLVFEKMEGGPLLSHIQRRGSLTEEESSSIANDLATAIGHLHKLGVAHRDVKPENVLCVSTDSPCPVKLCDFDLCSAPDLPNSDSLLSPVGSLEFMAPEVVDTFLLADEDDFDDPEVSLSYTKACDMWSLGVLLYILLSGIAPFTATCSDIKCGWQDGSSCSECQRLLLNAITAGDFGFPNFAWSSISSSAKDLVSCLLLKNSAARLTATEVLAHPWLASRENNNSSWASTASSWTISTSMDSSSMRALG